MNQSLYQDANENIKNRIALIGFRGVGKSSVGQSLQKILRLPYLSMDDYIARKAGLSVQQIVDTKGWSYFREMEFKCLQRQSMRKKIILDTGGGVFEDANGNLSQEKLEILKNNFFSVYLYMEDELILKRLRKLQYSMHRPALPGATELHEVLAKRKPWYEMAADISIDCSGMNVADSVREITRIL